MSGDEAVFVVERLEGNFALLRGPDGEAYYSSIARRLSVSAGSRIRVPRDSQGELDWTRMTLVAPD